MVVLRGGEGELPRAQPLVTGALAQRVLGSRVQ